MLKAHQACIDLEKSVLRIQGREVSFLSEHELPEKARMIESGVDDASASTSGSFNSASQPARTSGSRSAGNSGSSFRPGGGNTLGSAPSVRHAHRRVLPPRSHDTQILLSTFYLIEL
jgi:hypothetical protein